MHHAARFYGRALFCGEQPVNATAPVVLNDAGIAMQKGPRVPASPVRTVVEHAILFVCIAPDMPSFNALGVLWVQYFQPCTVLINERRGKHSSTDIGPQAGRLWHSRHKGSACKQRPARASHVACSKFCLVRRKTCGLCEISSPDWNVK